VTKRYAFLLAVTASLCVPTDAGASGYANAVLADSPQIYWRLAEQSGTKTVDSSPSRADGTFMHWDATTFAAELRQANAVDSPITGDPNDKAQRFVDDTYAETTVMPSVTTGAVEFWMRKDAPSNTDSNTVWRSSSPVPYGQEHWTIGQAGEAGTHYDLGGQGFGPMNGWIASDADWHYYVARWTTTGIELWRDAAMIYSTSNCCTRASRADEPFRVGNVLRQGAGSSWSLDEVATYPDLSPQRINTHFAARFAPTNLTRPNVTPADPAYYQRGAELTASHGTWSRNPSFSYQWLRCRPDGSACESVGSAGGDRYVLTAADVGQRLRVRVTAFDTHGSDTAESDLSPIVRPMAPVPQDAPEISAPDPLRDGVTVTTSPGTWGGDAADRYDYQWMRCQPAGGGCTEIPGALGFSYTAGADDVDRVLRVRVTASNAGGSSASESGESVVVAAMPLANAQRPTIRGIARQGELLTGDDGQWAGTRPQIQRAWLRCAASCARIRGANESTYEITGDDVGATIEYQVTMSNSANQLTLVSDPVGPVGASHETSTPPAQGRSADRDASTSPPDVGPENGRNLAGAPVLSLQFAANQRALETVSFGEPSALTGRLVNERGEPIVDAVVAIDERASVANDYRRVGEVTTDHSGSYALWLAPGPSRIVRATYRSHRSDRDPSATAQTQIAVLAGGRMRAVSAKLTLGEQAVFRGHLVGGPFPTNGIPVTLEAKDGPRWSEVARRRTTRDGAFEFRYRFCRTVRSYSYEFRVSIGQTAGWPYDPGATNATRVRVRVPRRISPAIVRRCK
jgi:hypothetical protein